MVATAICSVTMVLWKETAFPLCRAMERRWKKNVVSQVSSMIVVIRLVIPYYFASVAVAVDSSHMTASSSALWSRFSPPSNVVNGHVSTTWFMVCRWPQSREDDWVRPHLCKLVWHGPWPVRKWFIRDRVWWGHFGIYLFICFTRADSKLHASAAVMLHTWTGDCRSPAAAGKARS